MSLIHRLAVGLLDVEAVRRRELVTLGPLPAGVRGLIRIGVPGRELGGRPVEVTPYYLEGIWIDADGVNAVLARLARTAVRELGCLAADIAHGRLVSARELRDSYRVKP